MLMSIFKRSPVTFGLLALLWVFLITYQIFGLVPHVLNVHFLMGSIGGTIAITVFALLFSVVTERVLGSVRFAVAGLLSQVIGVPIALVLARGIGVMGLNQWGENLLGEPSFSLVGFFVGAAGYGSASLPVLWRRRVRLSLLWLTLTLVLYSGSMSDILAATTAGLGIAAGRIVMREQLQWTVSMTERRVLTAIAVGVLALGPLLVAMNPEAVGPFSSVSHLLWSPDASVFRVAAKCRHDIQAFKCQHALAHSRMYGFGPAVADLIPLFIQAVVCFGLVRGRRLAWRVAVVIQVAVIAILLRQLVDFHADGLVLHGVNVFSVTLPWLAGLALLFINRRVFRVRVSMHKLVKAVVIVAVAFGVAACVWVGGAFLLRGSFAGGATLPQIFFELPLRFIPPAIALLFPYAVVPKSVWAWILYEWVGTLFWIFVVIIAYRMFATPADPDIENGRRRAREILESTTGDHLSFMTMWNGNHYFFSSQTPGYVAYRPYGGIALTLGGPVGPPVDDRAALAQEFEDFAREHGLRPVWYSVDEEFKRPGFKSVQVAEEAILSTADTSFKGKKLQNVRTARNKAVKEGVNTVWTSWEELDRYMILRITELSEEWVADKSLPEMGFTLGGMDELKVPGTRLLLAVGADGSLHGVTSWLPVRRDGQIVGYILDVMRRADRGFKGAIELLLSEALIIAQNEGCEWLSLSGAPLASSPQDPGRLDALLSRVGSEMEPLYGFRSLAASKRRFQPTERAWYLVYDDDFALPAIGIAVAHAYLPALRSAAAVAALRTWARTSQSES